MAEFFKTLLLSALAVWVVSGCRGGKVAGLESSGSGTLKVKKKPTKEKQIEAIKAEMARQRVTIEQAASVEEALGGVAEVEDPAEQARLLLVALAEALASPGADEKLKEQMAHVVMGAAAELGLSLSRELTSAADTDVRKSLLETAAAGLVSRNVPAATVVAAASRQLLEEPGATAESVAALVTEVPSVASLPADEVVHLISVEKDKKEALTRACLSPERVTAGDEYYCPDGSRRVGSLQVPAPLPLCTQDGEVGCVTTQSIKGAVVAALPAKVLLGQTVAGESGVVRLPDISKVLIGESFGALDALTGTVVLPAASAVLAGTNYGPGSAAAGTFSPDFPDPANVRTIDTTNGVAGTYLPDFPDAASVRSTDTVNGAAGTLHDCTVDGDEGCVVPLSGALKAADTTNFSEWDIRRKRAPDGSVITFAGFEGRNKNCRNWANLTTGPDITDSSSTELPFNNTTVPASGTLVPDFFDTIDDYNDGQTGLPPNIVPWTVGGVAGTHGGDFTCGGIYATGLKNYSDGSPTPTGADATLDHDPNGNWQDLTPGIVPGGGNSTNTSPGCNAAEKFCVFRELISGLMVTEVSATTPDWHNAVNYCDNLGEAGGVITSPIPTLDVGLGAAHSDWRLPTQKELAHLSSAAFRGLNQTVGLVSLLGDANDGFWSASSLSSNTGNAWLVNLSFGFVYDGPKASAARVVCVR